MLPIMPTYPMRISWLFTYFLTNLESKTPFYNIGFDAGRFTVVGIPTRFPKYFLKLKLFIATKI